MSRILLLFSKSSYRAQAFLAAAGRLDVDVTVGSNHAPTLASQAPLATLTLGTGDVQRSRAVIERFAAEHPLAAVIAAEDDFAPVAAEASRALGLRFHSPAAVTTARNKALMRQRLSETGAQLPWFQVASVERDPGEVSVQMHYPCVLKPLSLSASRGVIRVDTPEEFCLAWNRILDILRLPDARRKSGSAGEDILIEEYLEGREVALEGIVVDGTLQTLAILDKPDPMEGPFFEETLMIAPSRLPEEVQREVVSTVQHALGALGLTNGPVHAEVRVEQGCASILEIAPRSIGGRCSTILRFEPEATLEDLILRHALGIPIDGHHRAAGAAGVMMLPIPRAGVLRSVTGTDKAAAVPGIERLEISIPVGQHVEPLPEGNRYLGFLFAGGGTAEQVEAALRQAYGELRVTIEAD